ncbi:M15 family metallopeptidase [Parabacteroides gordonii]|jgi:D-alanyl-D-alanine dipeptidase|uniref:M15 family metallopeptidase n=1 Tax=Parabacteroides gordonii TaxID=574930 RepID=UPI000EC29F16|nr:M15 family metallopeptidase [Parabacteroides gordonii]RGP17895.1 peptidase M15 [Parabacteroides gordonii]
MRQTRYIFLLLLLLCNLRSNAEELDTWLHDRGLVDISVLDSTIRVHLVYATPDNFMGETVYTGITRAWLHPDAAQKLVTAQRLLKKEHPDLTLVVYDAARPMSVQRKMWSLVRGTDKVNYVSNPSNGGGLHNYGMAVDVTILDPAGEPLPMGTPFDFFGEEAHTNNEEALLASGKITRKEFDNRRLLRRIMKSAGFRTIPYEWWHFNACSRTEARQSYPVLD